MPNVSFIQNDPEWLALERQRRLAEALAMQQEQMPPVNQMAGGFVVPTSPLEGLSRVARSVAGQMQLNRVDERQRALADRIREEGQQDTRSFVEALRGRPEEQLPTDVFGPPQPAQAPDQNRALAVALGSRNPMVQGAGSAMLAQMLKENEPVTVGRTLMTRTGKPIGVDATWQQEQQASREARMAELAAKQEDSRISRQERMEAQRQLLQMQIDARKDLLQASRDIATAGNGKPPQGYRWKPDGTLEAIPGGPADPKSKTGPDGMPKLTESQGKANLYQSRATEADKVISELEGQYSPLAINVKQGAGKVWGIGGALESAANVVLPKNAQKAEQAQRNFVNAILRQESGAVISESEFANAQKQYFPQPGDSKDVIDQKKKNRATAIAGLKVMAGPAASTSGASGGWSIQRVE